MSLSMTFGLYFIAPITFAEILNENFEIYIPIIINEKKLHFYVVFRNSEFYFN